MIFSLFSLLLLLLLNAFKAIKSRSTSQSRNKILVLVSCDLFGIDVSRFTPVGRADEEILTYNLFLTKSFSFYNLAARTVQNKIALKGELRDEVEASFSHFPFPIPPLVLNVARMLRPQIVLFSQDLSRCHCYHGIFRAEFEVYSIDTEETFVQKTKDGTTDAVVICFCSATKPVANHLLPLIFQANHLSVLTCTKTLDSDFIRLAVQHGAERFLLCTMEAEKIRALVLEAIQGGGLREFLQSCCRGPVSRHVRKMIDETIHAFPHRLHESEMARRLGISRSWVQKLCRQAFGLTFTRLMRRIWVHQALRLMQRTNLDNVEIAEQLNYSEESSLARDFRKELGCNPTEARKRLAEQSPEALLH